MALRIVVFAALSQETGPVLKLMPGWRSLARRPFRTWRHQSSGTEVLLVETGMGNLAAERAALHIFAGAVAQALPDLILSVGFAGALSPDLALGHAVYARELAVYDDVSRTCPVRFKFNPSADLAALLESLRVRPTRFVTVDRLRPKATLAELVPETPAVTEMESTSIAAAAHARNIAFLGLRAVSDVLSDEIEWDLDSMVDAHGRLSRSRVALAVLREPRLAGSFPGLYRGSKVAGDSLALTLAGLLALPEEELRALVGPLRA
jgi:adenosylhomocysteine nucleosidase